MPVVVGDVALVVVVDGVAVAVGEAAVVDEVGLTEGEAEVEVDAVGEPLGLGVTASSGAPVSFQTWLPAVLGSPQAHRITGAPSACEPPETSRQRPEFAASSCAPPVACRRVKRWVAAPVQAAPAAGVPLRVERAVTHSSPLRSV